MNDRQPGRLADTVAAMTDDQLAAIISFGLPGLLAALFFAGYLLGVKRATRRALIRSARELTARGGASEDPLAMRCLT